MTNIPIGLKRTLGIASLNVKNSELLDYAPGYRN